MAGDMKKIYERQFDSKAYVAEYVNDQSCVENWLIEEFYHNLFRQGKVSGETLLDVGCGPTVRPALSASKKVSRIYLSDFLERNLTVIEKWRKNEEDCVDFSAEFKYVAQLEGKKDTKYLEERVRNSIAGLFRYDVAADLSSQFKSFPDDLRQFDIVTSSLCLDCVTEDKDYFKAMKNLADLVSPGGHLALVNAIEGTMYKVGKQEIVAAWIDEEKIRNAMADAKLIVVELKKHIYKSQLEMSDEKGLFTVLATKGFN
uniref:Methyltransferase type 11 domain-containing protein n=1 Tax=Strigamia maritima TaxID=126957 RepID=T1ITU6_STRMM